MYPLADTSSVLKSQNLWAQMPLMSYFSITHYPQTSGSAFRLLAIQTKHSEDYQQTARTFPLLVKQETAMNIKFGEQPSSFRAVEHQVRNALTAILGSADLLNDETLTAEQQSHVNAIAEAGNQLLASLNALSAELHLIEQKKSVYLPLNKFQLNRGTPQAISGMAELNNAYFSSKIPALMKLRNG